jgi:hypothetical protein
MVSLGQLWRLRAPGSIAGVCQKFEEFDAERARGQVTSGRSLQGLEDYGFLHIVARSRTVRRNKVSPK